MEKSSIPPLPWAKKDWITSFAFFLLTWIPALILLAEHNLDVQIQLAHNSVRQNPSITDPFLFISLFGIYIILAVILIMLFMSFKSDSLKEMQRVIFVVFFSIILTIITFYVIKQIVNRNRPCEEIVGFIGIGYCNFPPSDRSFPSGHTSTIFAIVLPFVFFLKSSNKKTLVLRLFLFAFALLIGYSRILLGVHYLSDVIAGMGLGFLMLGISTLLANLIITKTNITQVKLEKILKIFAFLAIIVIAFLVFKEYTENYL